MGQTLPPRVYPERTKRCGVWWSGLRDYILTPAITDQNLLFWDLTARRLRLIFTDNASLVAWMRPPPATYLYRMDSVAYLALSSGNWSTPLSSGTTASSAVHWQLFSLIIESWQLLPTINLLASEIYYLNSSFPSLPGLKQPSLSVSFLQERVN